MSKTTRTERNEHVEQTEKHAVVQEEDQIQDELQNEVIRKARLAKAAATQLAVTSTADKNDALMQMAARLLEEQTYIIHENEKDLAAGREKGLSTALLDRLTLNEKRIQDMAESFRQIAELEDPVGQLLDEWQRPDELRIQKVSVPLGVAGMIYEARPNVTADASGLCLKSGNAVILRGSSSALQSNKAIVSVLHRALQQTELPTDAVQLLEDTSRKAAARMFTLNEYLDVLIPRGGANLIQSVLKQASVPVLETGVGNCHVYIDASADPDMAVSITVNAKTNRPSVCNAAETVIVHEQWAKDHLSYLLNALQDEQVELRVDEKVRTLYPESENNSQTATTDDWHAEYLDRILAVKIVSHIDEAIDHIRRYGTKHSEAIITESDQSAERFFAYVDAAAVYHNASTRFTDGFEFGFGAEIGISTQKLHARGPMGLQALTSYKYLLRGSGQTKG